MAKDTLWFPHDIEPTTDPKMQAMLGDYGGLGYGAYWRIVEMLHSDNQHKLPFKKYIFSAIAKQMQANANQNKNLNWLVNISSADIETFVTDCIKEYELFSSDETHFFSNRVFRNIDKRGNISEVRSIAGKSGAIAKQNKAIAKQNEAEKNRVDKNRDNKEDSFLSLNTGKEKLEKNGKQYLSFDAQREEISTQGLREKRKNV